MNNPVAMAEVWRGEFLECVHVGHAVVCDASGNIVQAWGDPDAVILPRSSCKMIQALPLIESGAADAFGLTQDQLALSCASHQAAAIHTDRVQTWLANLGLSDEDFRCGPQMPNDWDAKQTLIKGDQSPCRYHNNCSGKHSGFLTTTKHLKAGPEYVDLSHPLQLAVREAFEDVTRIDSPGFGIDGCSAPNFATTVHGLARAMGFFAAARDDGPLRNRAAARLVEAMMAYPELVAGEGRACTDLMRAMGGNVALKGGAEGVYVAILPEKGLGVALKIRDGASRGSECAIAAILVSLGALDANDPVLDKWMDVKQRNFDGLETGYLRPAIGFPN
ncbi:MAG: L-asparaginase [Marinosulfonomonas sp.]|nr:MAG: L-asparaginase [Marinosulfonomonas sp.]